MAFLSTRHFRVFLFLLFFITSLLVFYGTKYDALAPFSLFNPKLRQSEPPRLIDYLVKNENLSDDSIFMVTWTKMFGTDWVDWTKKTIERCDLNPQARCVITSDRNFLNRSAAVLFHPRDIVHTDLPAVKYEHQKYVFHSSESPVLTFAALRGASRTFFDWTMTYRTDSTIYCPYSYFQPLGVASIYSGSSYPTELDRVVDLSLAKRPKMAMWIASNCDTHSKRERYVYELRKYLDIDIFGDCGETCEKNDTFDCIYQMAKDYKFYISFENAMCRDYISEKFGYRMALNLVPIVLRREDYDRAIQFNLASFEREVENRSRHYFIAADDFNSPKDLADYIFYLVAHPKEYLKYFQWRQRYKIVLSGGRFCYCDLCVKLYEERQRRREAMARGEPLLESNGQSEFDIDQWWNVDTCDRGMALKLLEPGRKVQHIFQ